MTKKHSMLKPAQLKWQETTPVSTSFDDFYFSTDNGLDETRYVFLQANQLPARFSGTPLEKALIIAETGFGSGLNFLACWHAWKQLDQPKRPLHFFSVEKFPLKQEDLQVALANWPELETEVQALLDAYPVLVEGLHCLDFEDGQVRLNLVFGDISTLSKHDFHADIWFLDGFSPKKNPEMWSLDVFREIARHTAKGCTFSTFTSASDIRRRLQEAGFEVHKRVGFGVKREMLFGHIHAHQAAAKHAQNLWSCAERAPQDTFAAESTKTLNGKHALPAYDVAIIGAGLAGLASAYELSQQGLSVCLLEGQSAPVMGASGQTQLAMYAKLPSEANKLFHFTIHALCDSMLYYRQIQDKTTHHLTQPFWHPCGLMQLAWNEKELRKQTQFMENIQLPASLIALIDAQTASQLSGLSIDTDALWFPNAGWLNPQQYARAILENYNIDCQYSFQVTDLAFEEAAQTWQIQGGNARQLMRARHVVIANANAARHFAQCQHLPTKPLRGQVTSIQHSSLTCAKTVICGEGYLCPALNDWHHFGATFDLKGQEAVIKEEDTQANIRALQKWLPGWLKPSALSTSKFHHSAGLRCTTPDYLPIVGPAPIADQMIESFSRLRVDANACADQYGHYYPNLYLNIGHGSKGLFSSPLSAKLIRHYICGGLSPCSEEHRVMLSPARFLIKHLCQRRI